MMPNRATSIGELAGYTRLIERGEDGVFTASLLEIPGAIAEGDTEVEALRNLEDALPDLLAVMAERGAPIPEPINPARYTGRLQLRLTPSLHARAATLAAWQGVSLNRVLADAIASYVGFNVSVRQRSRSVSITRTVKKRAPAARKDG